MSRLVCPPRIVGRVFIIFAIVLLGSTLSSSQNSPKESAAAAHMRGLNNSLLKLHGQMQQSDGNSARGLRSQAASVLAQRGAALTALIQNEPRAALTFAFSPELLADLAEKFPQSTSSLESHTTVSGKVDHWVADFPGLKRSRSWWSLDANGHKLNLYFASSEPKGLRSGDVLQASGVLAGSQMAVEQSLVTSSSALLGHKGESPTVAAQSAVNPQSWLAGSLVFGMIFSSVGVVRKRRPAYRSNRGIFARLTTCFLVVLLAVANPAASFAQTNSCNLTTGEQRIAVLLVTFPGIALPSNVTPQSLDDIFFNTSTGVSLDGFLREASYGQTYATGNVFGPFTLTGTYTTCSDVSGPVLNDAMAAAVAGGADLQNYSRIFVVFPDKFACGWAGLASSSCSSAGSSTSSSSTFLATAYLTSRAQGVELASHEIGHNFGLMHSGTISSGTDVLGPLSSPGTEYDMGDYWSTMGEMSLGLYPSPQKSGILGWMSPANYQVVQASGSYTLQPLEISPPGLQALKVQRGTGSTEWLWIEYRQPIGNYDSTIFPQPFSGALIHYEDSTTTPGHTYLPNFTPSVSSAFSPALSAGQTWTDPYSNLSLTVAGATSAGLTVSVNYGGGGGSPTCTHSNPAISVAPLDPSIYPGGAASYALSVTNNDASVCPPSTFNLGSSQPPGWGTSFSQTSVTLGPGQSAPITMSKVGPSGTPPGIYAVDASAASNPFFGSNTANVTVIAAPSLMVNVSVPGSTFSTRSTIPISSLVSNGGVPVSGASVTFTLTFPNGSSLSQASTTNSNGTATWNYKLGPRSPSGTYAVSAKATLTSGTRKATSTQTALSSVISFIVQ